MNLFFHHHHDIDPSQNRRRQHPAARAAAMALAACIAAGTVIGCGPLSGFSSTAQAGETAGPAEGSTQSSAENTQSSSSSGSESLLTLPYEASDPAQSASAHAWLCSDLVENVDKLDGLTETEDFHAAVIPSGYVSFDSFAERQLEVDADLQKILESDQAFSDPYIDHCRKLSQDYYKMWLDWDARDAAGVEPLRGVVAPLLEVKTLEDMTKYLSDPDTTIRALPLCSAFTAANPNDADTNAVYISPPGLVFQDPMYYDYLEADSWYTQPRYMNAAGYMLTRLGYSDEERDQILQDSYAFECDMASSMMTTAEQNAEDAAIRSNNPRTLQDLEKEQGNFPLTGMLAGAGVEKSEVFILEEPEWLACMNSLYTEENLEKMKAYLLVSDVLQFMELLDHDCYNQMVSVRNTLSGSTGKVDDKKAATDAVNEVLEMELGEVYAQTFITDKTRTDVTSLINDVIVYYRSMLQGEDFLSDATKAEAIKKLDKLTIRVASPVDFEEEDKALERAESSGQQAQTGETADAAAPGNGASADAAGAAAGAGTDGTADAAAAGTDGTADAAGAESKEEERVLDFKGPEEGGSLVDARIAISRETCLSIADQVNQPVDRSIWIASPQDVNAYYYPLDNSINIPAGILGGIFYSDEMSREEKLGHIGVIVAHEISHAFDTSGRQYDEQGNLSNWWTEDDYRKFHQRAQKLVDYYNGFEPIPNYPVNGAMLDTEAIADLTGVKCMLRIAADEENFDYDRFFRTLASNWSCSSKSSTRPTAQRKGTACIWPPNTAWRSGDPS